MKQATENIAPSINDHEIDPTAGKPCAPISGSHPIQLASPVRRFANRTTDGAIVWQRGGEQVRIEAVADSPRALISSALRPDLSHDHRSI